MNFGHGCWNHSNADQQFSETLGLCVNMRPNQIATCLMSAVKLWNNLPVDVRVGSIIDNKYRRYISVIYIRYFRSKISDIFDIFNFMEFLKYFFNVTHCDYVLIFNLCVWLAYDLCPQHFLCVGQLLSDFTSPQQWSVNNKSTSPNMQCTHTRTHTHTIIW